MKGRCLRYVPQSAEKLDAYLEWMNKAGYYVDDMFYMTDKLSGPQAFNMARLSSGGQGGRTDGIMHMPMTGRDDSRWKRIPTIIR